MKEVYVSSNDNELKRESEKYGAKIIDRPDYLAQDNTTGIEVLRHFAEKVEADYYVLIQATFVPISSEIIDGCINAIDDVCNLVVCVSPTKDRKLYWKRDPFEGEYISPWYNEWMIGQEFEKRILVENGACYVFSKEFLEDNLNFGDRGVYARPYVFEGGYVDIDYNSDMVKAEVIMKKLKFYEDLMNE